MGTKDTSIWDGVYAFVVAAKKRGITADEIVQKTGWNRSTVSSYLTILMHEGYLVKTPDRRKITSGRSAAIYVCSEHYQAPSKKKK